MLRATLRPRLLSQSDISSDSDSGQGGKPLIEKEEKVSKTHIFHKVETYLHDRAIGLWQCHAKVVLLRHGGLGKRGEEFGVKTHRM